MSERLSDDDYRAWIDAGSPNALEAWASQSAQSPMTISIEEYVARAIWKAKHPLKPYELADRKQREGVDREARAAIAAVREHEASRSITPDLAEVVRAKCEAIAHAMWKDVYWNGFTGSALDALKGVEDRIAALKGNGEG